MQSAMQALLLSLMLAPALAATEASAAEAGANPIRRVVSMLQMMENKITKEGKAEGELFEKFFCYCKSGAATLGKSIGDAETKQPQLESSINEAVSQKSQLEADLVSHKQSREDAKGAMAKAKEIREKEAGDFAKEFAEDTSNLDSLTGAIAAIEKGMSGGFLQTNAAAVLRRLTLTQELTNVDRDQLSSFLSQGSGQFAPASGEIVGILKQLKDTMSKDLADLVAQENGAKQEFDGLIAAKEKEVEELTASIEEKTKRLGEVGVEIVNLKEDLDDTTEALMEDKKFLADLDKNCATKQKEWDEIQKQRTLELGAIADTIKILSDDDALEMFKKALPSASLLQVRTSSKQVRDQALRALAGVRHRDVSLDFIALALRGKKVNFDKVLVMIDDMVALLGKEQVDDDGKKTHCAAEFDKSDDTKKALERSISDLAKVIEEDEGSVKVLEAEIEALNTGIHDLDKEVAGATEQRKSEHADFSAMLASNAAAADIIDFAKNRMQKFYNPKLYKAPPKKELTEEERITQNMGGASFVQIRLQSGSDDDAAPGDAPATPGAHKKSEAGGGVLAMMDALKADLEKENQEMEFAEKDAQEEYVSMVNDAAAKRGADSKSIAEKEAAKAGLEAAIVSSNDAKAGTTAELMATKEYIAGLHADCDWLIANYQTRKDARATEVDALKNAKAVLSGADYSL